VKRKGKELAGMKPGVPWGGYPASLIEQCDDGPLRIQHRFSAAVRQSPFSFTV